jgi:hypothetical protein
MNYRGVIIEESVADKAVLGLVKIISTEVEPVTNEHKTQWIKQWTLDAIEVSEDSADGIAKKISDALDKEHNWYADFKNDEYHYIIYRGRVFKVDLKNPTLYKDAKQYGVSLDIPEYQVDFAPEDKIWER